METIEIPQYELMNYLPYCLIEEALEISPADLFRFSSTKSEPRRESRISGYLMNKKSAMASGAAFESLIGLCNFEQEVSKEIKKIMHKQSLFSALKKDSIFEQTENQIKTLLDDQDKENQNPMRMKQPARKH